jgi:hypothetical protein
MCLILKKIVVRLQRIFFHNHRHKLATLRLNNTLPDIPNIPPYSPSNSLSPCAWISVKPFRAHVVWGQATKVHEEYMCGQAAKNQTHYGQAATIHEEYMCGSR